jgi:hypothetical protein
MRATLLAYVVVHVALGVGLLIILSDRDFNSDEAAQQTILATWQDGYHDRAYVPADNYVIKIPIYAALAAVISNPRIQLIIASIVFNLAGFALFTLGAHLIWRECLATGRAMGVVAIVWLATLGAGLYEITVNPNTRNLEIGIAFCFLAGFVRYLQSGWRVSPAAKIALGVITVMHGLFIFSTAYYLIFLLTPLGFMLSLNIALGRWEVRKCRLLMYLFVSVLTALAWQIAFDRIGLVIRGNTLRFVTSDQIGFHLRLLLESTLSVFDANLLGRKIASLGAIRSSTQLTLLVPVLAFPVWLWQSRRGDAFWGQYFAALPYFAALVFVGTNYVADFGSRRYLIVVPFAAAISIAFMYEHLTAPRLRSLLALSLALNIALGIGSVALADRPSGDSNAESARLISLTKSLGLDKGYAQFWQSTINTFLSKNDVTFIQVVCVGDRLRLFPLLVDDGILDKSADRSFYLYDSQSPEIADCTLAALEPQFGAPIQVIEVDESLQLAIYPYDISAQFDSHT